MTSMCVPSWTKIDKLVLLRFSDVPSNYMHRFAWFVSPHCKPFHFIKKKGKGDFCYFVLIFEVKAWILGAKIHTIYTLIFANFYTFLRSWSGFFCAKIQRSNFATFCQNRNFLTKIWLDMKVLSETNLFLENLFIQIYEKRI